MSGQPANALSHNIAAFCRLLRADHGFAIGQAEAHDALRALATVGIVDESRVRSALRLVCCGTRDQRVVFDRAFSAFFRPGEPGVAQAPDTARHTRPDRDAAPPRGTEHRAARPNAPAADASDGAARAAAERRESDDESHAATRWQMLRARYSPVAAPAAPPHVDFAGYRQMLAAASTIVAGVRLGRSRRWKRSETGGRLDLRRTIRASLQTGGDPVDIRYLGHPRRNPRFVVLIDGSRSMAEYAPPMLAFSRALAERSGRAHVFLFSTALREITRELRAAVAGEPLPNLGNAWGGGTRIGANLAAFTARYGALLDADTLIFIFSDGLDSGDVGLLERALRLVHRRCAGVVWLNPHAGTPDYRPTARGMRVALPFLTLLTAANDPAGFTALAHALSGNARIRGRRR